MADKGGRGRNEEVTAPSTYTKRLHGCTFKKKAPDAIKEMDVCSEGHGNHRREVDVKLNKYIWSRGIRSTVPRRVRVRIARKRDDEEDAKEELSILK